MNETYKVQVQDLVDDLKAVFTHAGLGGGKRGSTNSSPSPSSTNF